MFEFPIALVIFLAILALPVFAYIFPQTHAYREWKGGKWIEADYGSKSRWFPFGEVPDGWYPTGMIHRTSRYQREKAADTNR